MTFSTCIKQAPVRPDEVAIYYLAQAGFCVKTSADTLIYIDPYFSNYCQREVGFKRMIPPLLIPEELAPDALVCTHAHADHLDPDALPILARNAKTFFIGAPDCLPAFRDAGLAQERYVVLVEGESTRLKDIEFTATYADHGDLAPDAIGFLLTIGDISIYNAGDTAYTPERILLSLIKSIDIVIAPINGQFGNLDAKQACQLGALVKPRMLIASHFWMFIEHGGDPAAFLAEAESLPDSVTPVVMAPGEELVYSQTQEIVRRRIFDVMTGAWHG